MQLLLLLGRNRRQIVFVIFFWREINKKNVFIVFVAVFFLSALAAVAVQLTPTRKLLCVCVRACVFGSFHLFSFVLLFTLAHLQLSGGMKIGTFSFLFYFSLLLCQKFIHRHLSHFWLPSRGSIIRQTVGGQSGFNRERESENRKFQFTERSTSLLPSSSSST